MLTIGLILFMLCFVASRFIMSSSVATLSVEQKATLVDASTARRPWLLVVFVAVLLVPALATAYFGYHDWLFIGFVIVGLAMWISLVFLRFRRLSTLALPPAYLRRARLSTFLLGLGLICFFGAMVYRVITFVPQ
jgi:hypothetical protein